MQNHALYCHALCKIGIISHFGHETTFAFTTTFRVTMLVIKIKKSKRRVTPCCIMQPSLGIPDTYTMEQIETHLLQCVL